MKALVIDLDDTLVDTSGIAQLRNARNWRGCANNFHQTACFGEIAAVIATLRRSGVKVGIVTNSVSFYAQGLLSHHRIDVDALVAWHDTKAHKPSPDPVRLCLEKLGIEAVDAVGVGDAADDASAYLAAGIGAWGAGWSSALQEGAWDEIVSEPSGLLTRFGVASN